MIIESLNNQKISQTYKRLEISHYFGEDLIAGIESPKYVLNFYNLALRSNFIKKNFFKKIIHENKKKNLKISSGKSNEYLGRFFSELYGIDQNHLLQNSDTNFLINRIYPIPKNDDEKSMAFVFSTLKNVKDRTTGESQRIINTSLQKELRDIKKASLFGIISKKWIKNYIKESIHSEQKEITSQSEKSKWTTFFIKEVHSLYLGVSKKEDKCHVLINIHLKDSKMTKKEKNFTKKTIVCF